MADALFIMNKFIYSFAALVLLIALNINFNGNSHNTSSTINTNSEYTIYRKSINSVEYSESDATLYSNAMSVMNTYFDGNTNVYISHIDASVPYIEICNTLPNSFYVDDYIDVMVAEFYLSLTKLNSETTIINSHRDGYSPADYRAMKIYMGDQKPKYWEETFGYNEEIGVDIPWETNRGDYGLGLCSNYDYTEELERVSNILISRGLTMITTNEIPPKIIITRTSTPVATQQPNQPQLDLE